MIVPPVTLPFLDFDLPMGVPKMKNGRETGGVSDIPPVAQTPCTSGVEGYDGRKGGTFSNSLVSNRF